MTEAGNENEVLIKRCSPGGGDPEAGAAREISRIERLVSSNEMSVENTEDRVDENIHNVDIDRWVDSLSRKLEDVPLYMHKPGHPGRISRIPQNIREVEEKAYEPHFLSIGPYHHAKQRVQKMEKKKLEVLKCFLQLNPEVKLKDYLKEIELIEQVARSFYADFEMDRMKFVQMLLLDSLFILPLFCRMPESQESENQNSPISGNSVKNEDTYERINHGLITACDTEDTKMFVRADDVNPETRSEGNKPPRLFSTIFMHDLFLLENQLPLFVLQKIYTLAYNRPETHLIEILKNEMGYLLSDYIKLDSVVISPNEEVHHLLHLCHLFFRPTIRLEHTRCEVTISNDMFRLGSAVQLYEAGVRFEVRSTSSQHSLLDISFGGSGKLLMPSLHVEGNTDSLLRNLIALEQMKYPSMGLNVSAYVVLLLHLITTPRDVELLRRKGIIQHHLASDKEMLNLVNRLSMGLSFDYVEDNYSLKPVFNELKRYSERRVPRWRAWLKHRHFSNPWTVTSLLAASILLLLTFLQTYYTVYSYYVPR